MPRLPEPLRVIIADDEPLARRRIRSLLLDEPGVGSILETSNGPETIEAIRAQPPHVLFLDVQMPGADGIEVLEVVGPQAVGAVVLVTAFAQYALAAFEHQALDYVLKPVDEDRFRATLARVRTRLSEQQAGRFPHYLSRIMVRAAQVRTVVEVSDIDWIEANGDYLSLHCGRQVHLHRETLGALEQRLDPAHFVRIHRSTIVRISQVKQMEPYFHGDYVLTLHSGKRLRLSRTYRARLQASLEGIR